MQLVLTDTQDCPLSVTARDRKGASAPVSGQVWSTSDPAVVTVTPDATDPSKAVASAVAPGTAVITFTADADPSDQVVNIIGTLDVVVGAGQATVVEIAAGTPVEQTPASPGATAAGATSGQVVAAPAPDGGATPSAPAPAPAP